MSSLGRRNIPPKSYAIKKAMPTLRRQVQQTLTNRYGQAYQKEDATTIDTYYIMSKDSYYQGSWMGGLPHGPGIAIYPDGSYYKGNFDCGQAQDEKGYLILSNGAQYEGNIVKSKIQGKGKLTHKWSYSYVGDWVNGKPHGWGEERFEGGSSYSGFFENGLKHCFDQTKTIQQKKKVKPQKLSTYKHEGDVYVGEFKQGLMHGYGELTNKQKDFHYCGQFVNGKKQGYGSLITSQGTLTGNFHNDVINGEGIFEWKDKRRYEGSFKNSKFQGEGKIIFPEGNQLIGRWRQGQSESLKALFGNTNMNNSALKQGNYSNYKRSGY